MNIFGEDNNANGQSYDDFTGATNFTDGSNGLVPKPLVGQQDFYLKGDGTWKNTIVTVSNVANGSQTNPSYSFSSDPNTGIYTSAGDNLDFTTGGVRRMNLNLNGLKLLPSGSAAAPSFSFINDTNTGIYSSAADNLDFTTNGVQRINIGSTGLINLKGNKLIGVTAGGQNTVFADSGIGGSLNTAVGYNAGNVSFGPGATWNTFVGHNAGLACSTGGNNTIMGAGCSKNNVTGSNNVAIGAYCADTNTSGSNNVMIGYVCRMVSGSPYSNSIGIGANCVVRANNEIVFGDETASNVIRSGRDNGVSLGTSTKRFSVVYAATGTINTSDSRQKIIDGESIGLDEIMKLKPVSYRWIENGVRNHYGFLAQDIETLINNGELPDSGLFIKTGVLEDGNDINVKDITDETKIKQFNYGLRYSELIAPLVKAVQELAVRVEALEKA